MKFIKRLGRAAWLTFMVVGPLVLVLVLAGFKHRHKDYYSMKWLVTENPFSEEREIIPRTVRLPDMNYVDLCSTVGCQTRTMVELTGDTKDHVRKIMSHVKDAASERERLAEAIAYLETYSCPRDGTCHDRPGVGGGRAGQKDCVDEATNTTSFMLWMTHNGMLRFHVVMIPDKAGWHWFPVIQEIPNGERYVVESDFNATGQRPKIERI